MSHELRTPLNAIAGYVDLLELGIRGPVTADQRQDLARIKRSQKTLLRLVEDVLNFAKIEAGRLEYHYEDVRVGELLDGLETFIAPKLGQKGLSYSLDPCELDAVITIDRTKVEQILLNLLSNAIKFTDTGSVHLSCHCDDALVRFHVRDTGRGIPAEDLDTIFEPFVQGETTLAKRMEGTGLGLSISRKLARDMGGDVFVESTIGEGSTFTVVLPRAK
jgi:signal transduction histidine kinase